MFDLAPPAAAPLPLQQHPVFAQALRRLRVRVDMHETAAARAQVICRRWPGIGSVGLVSRGPVWVAAPDPDALAALRRDLGLAHLLVNAETLGDAGALRAAGFLRLNRPRQVAELALTGDPADWRARMAGKWRNRLVHAESQGLMVRRKALPPDPGHWLFAREAEQQQTRRYRGLPPALIAAIAAEDARAAQLFTADRAGRPVAAMLFLWHGSGATYQIGWTGPDGRRLSAHNLLLWSAMQWLAARGVQRLDLGGVEADTPGLARFKLGSGAVARQMGGTWLQSGVLSPLHAARRWRLSPPRP